MAGAAMQHLAVIVKLNVGIWFFYFGLYSIKMAASI